MALFKKAVGDKVWKLMRPRPWTLYACAATCEHSTEQLGQMSFHILITHGHVNRVMVDQTVELVGQCVAYYAHA